jgi:phosphonate transport system substrate-binding protein
MRFHIYKFLAGCALSVLALTASAQQTDLVLGISEGTSGGLDHAQVIVKYQGLADAMSRAAKRKVVVVFAREFAQLEEGMKSGRYDFVMARPSDYPARGIRNYGYQYVASAKPDGQCLIVAPLGSDITTLAQAKGKRWIFPEKISYMSKFCYAEMRDKGIKMEVEKLIYVREQALIAQYIDIKLVDVGGIASYSGIARQLEKNKLQVIHKSVAQPYFPLVANKKVSKVTITALQKELVGLNDAAGGADVLKSIGIDGFETNSAARLSQLLVWLEK